MSYYLPALIMLPFIAALLSPWLRNIIGIRIGSLLAVVPAFLFFWSLAKLDSVASGQTIHWDVAWLPSLGIQFSLAQDGLGLFFTLLITGIGTLIFLYADSYLGPNEDRGKFFLYLFLFMTAMLGIVTARNLVVLYAFWEMTSLTSFLLIGFWFHRKASREGALKSLLVTSGGGLAMLAGIILLYLVTGTLDLEILLTQRNTIVQDPLYPAIFILILIGALTKSAQVPFHLWLPSAMEAPTPVSGYLHSATMVKAGLYLMLRLSPVLGGTDLWFLSVSSIGIFTLLWASFVAIRQTDLKAILAFSTISQLGLITSLIGWGTPHATIAAVAHIINHAIFKAGLFMVVGIIDHETGTRDVRKLGGLARFMPLTALAAVVTSLALGGIPGFNGFVSKELFLEASLGVFHEREGYTWVFPWLAVTGSAFTLVYSLMIAYGVFFDRRSPEHKTTKNSLVHEAPAGMLFPPLLLAAASLLAGWVPGLLQNRIVGAAAQSALGGSLEEVVHLKAFAGFNQAFALSLIIIIAGLLLYSARRLWFPLWRGMTVTPNVNQVYEGMLSGLMHISRSWTRLFMTGFLADSMGYMLGFLLLAAAAGFLTLPVLAPLRYDLASMEWYEAGIVLLGILGSLAALFVRTRTTALLSLGVVGLVVVLLFVFVQAPDLALTQLIVETVTLILFLIVFRNLPVLRRETVSWRIRTRRLVLSILSGALVTVLLLAVNATPAPPKEITEFYLQNSDQLAGGHNVVNVILVDFRGFDTMGEITVIALAALGVYALIKYRAGGSPS